jgi:transposase
MDVLAIDVAKGELVVYDSKKVFTVENRPKQIDMLLAAYPGYAVVLEPTSTYHLELATRAHRLGRTVYLVNPRKTHYFAKSSNCRANTDPIMAEVLHEYLHAFLHKLKPWSPMPEDLRRLKSLVQRWFHLGQMRSKLVQVHGKDTSPALEATLRDLSALIDDTERQAIAQARSVDDGCYKRVHGTVGFGPFAACAYTFLLSSKTFQTADALCAFVGLDLQVADSGKRKGRRFLTKHGDRVLRYATTCAGRGLLNSSLGRNKNEELKARNRKHAERLVIAGRKLIRTIFALHQQQKEFDPAKFVWALDNGP